MSVLWQQQTHGVPKRREQRDRALALLFLSVVGVIVLLAASYLSLLASNVHLSSRAWTMEQEWLQQQRANQALTVEVARQSSIPVLQQRSIALGYQPAEQVDYLWPATPVQAAGVAPDAKEP